MSGSGRHQFCSVSKPISARRLGPAVGEPLEVGMEGDKVGLLALPAEVADARSGEGAHPGLVKVSLGEVSKRLVARVPLVLLRRLAGIFAKFDLQEFRIRARAGIRILRMEGAACVVGLEHAARKAHGIALRVALVEIVLAEQRLEVAQREVVERGQQLVAERIAARQEAVPVRRLRRLQRRRVGEHVVEELAEARTQPFRRPGRLVRRRLALDLRTAAFPVARRA